MDQDIEMTDNDSEFCTFYEFPSKAFPRFRYFQDNLISFYPRFQKAVEILPVCFKWKDLIEDVSKKAKVLEQSKPEVILFGEKHSMIKAEQIVFNMNRLKKEEFKAGTFSRKDLPSRVSMDTPQVLVYRCLSDQVVQEIILLLEKELPITETVNVHLLIDAGEQSGNENEGRVLRKKIIASLSGALRKFWKDKMIVITVDQTLSTKISNHLEICILKEFARIDDCIRELLSVRRNMKSISSFERDLISEVKKFLQNKEVVQDLMYLAYQKEGRNQFLQEQIILLIQRVVSEEFHAQFKMAAGDIHAMLEEMKFKEECKTNISPSTWSSIQSHLSGDNMESQQSEEPMETDHETGKKSMKHRKISEKQQQSKLSDNRAKTLMMDLQPVLEKVKIFLEEVQLKLKTLSHLHFELNGILKNTILSPRKEVPDIRYKLENWTKKLLELPEVQGCGDHFGNLIILISNENDKRKEQEVKRKIAMCLSGCPYDYDIKYSTKPRTFANPRRAGACNLIFKAGQKIRWSDQGGDIRHGTLGIFVLGKKEQSVYFVTNGHVVFGEGTVDISVNQESYEELGTEMWNYISELIDIAAVKVKSNMHSHCMFHYENYHGEQCSYVVLNTSEDTLEELVGQKVYKRGAETGLRVGIISSKAIKMKEDELIKTYNLVISPLAMTESEEAEFAKEGDSGSVVCLYTAEENNSKILAMIIGGFELKPSEGNQISEQNEEKLCISFSLMEGVNALNEKYQLDLEVET
ncbi:hypothetical protein ACJMK2_012415 [Sinanodonta woodiana]|uniref:Nal1 C-terminal domain-containing protein n=1 Tax=Sinanodonta woodiana TaxID=1069815 RepID=A0ABD3V862_SINWO